MNTVQTSGNGGGGGGGIGKKASQFEVTECVCVCARERSRVCLRLPAPDRTELNDDLWLGLGVRDLRAASGGKSTTGTGRCQVRTVHHGGDAAARARTLFKLTTVYPNAQTDTGGFYEL